MAFVYEVVPEEELNFLKEMKLKDCWENRLLYVDNETEWCADRERQAYLIGIGGGYYEMPDFYDLWWKGNVIRIEAVCGSKGSYEVGVDIIWYINRIPIPQNMWNYKNEILIIIKEAFEVNRDWCKEKFLKSIIVNIKCEPEMMEVK